MQRLRLTLTVPLVLALAIVSTSLTVQITSAATVLGLILPKPPAGDPPNGRLAGGGVRFLPPPIPLGDGPGGRPRGGASRDLCPRSPIPLTALVPWSQRPAARGQTKPVYDVWGLTMADRPTFWFYVPYNKQDVDYSVAFILQDDAENEVYRSTITPPDAPGIVSVSMPSQTAALEVGKTYHWYFYLYCGKKQTSSPIFVEGLIQRVNPTAKLASQLANATPIDQVKLYASNGIWFDALTALADLYHANLNDRTLRANWQSLLQAIDVEDAIVAAPLVR